MSKRSEWTSLKSSGVLDGLDEQSLDEDAVARIDQVRLEIQAKSVKGGADKIKSPLLKKRLLRSAKTSQSVVTGDDDLSNKKSESRQTANEEEEEEEDNEQDKNDDDNDDD